MQYLRPRQLEDALRRFPVIYIPFGLIEWHGKHLPLGNDALKAHAILAACAERFGGVVYPPVYLSETLTRALLTPVLTQLFFQLKATGCRVLLAVSGHNTFGQIDLLRDALAPVLASGGIAGEAQWDIAWNHADRPGCVQYLPDGRLLIDGEETTIQRDAESCSDHAAKWETSNMLFFYPEHVDLHALGTDPIALDMSPPHGIGGLDPRVYASEDVGRRNVEIAVDWLGNLAQSLLASLPEDQRVFSLPAIGPEHWWAV